jgi:hypothetical protein
MDMARNTVNGDERSKVHFRLHRDPSLTPRHACPLHPSATCNASYLLHDLAHSLSALPKQLETLLNSTKAYEIAAYGDKRLVTFQFNEKSSAPIQFDWTFKEGEIASTNGSTLKGRLYARKRAREQAIEKEVRASTNHVPSLPAPHSSYASFARSGPNMSSPIA